MRVSLIFRKVCTKVFDMTQWEALYEETITVLCLLEKSFPPSFFDVMTHLLIHIVEQLRVCGPVSTRWMYPFERYMKTLKHFVKNKAML